MQRWTLRLTPFLVQHGHGRDLPLCVEKHKGRVVDTRGDNLLAEFASVVDALMAENGKKKVAIKDQKEILKAILTEAREIPMEAYPAAVGVGLDERYKGNLSIGKSLSFEGDTIHFCAFSQ